MCRSPLRTALVGGLLLLSALGARAPAAQPGTLDVAGTTVGAPTAALPLFGSTPGDCSLAADPEPYHTAPFAVTPDGSYAVDVVEPISTIPDTDDTVLLVYEGTFDPADACAGFVGIGNEVAGSGLTGALTAGDYVLVVAGFYTTEDAFTVRITITEGGDPVACSPGSYSTTGNTPCMPAPAGAFVAEAGATEATLCAVGTYQPDEGQIACLLAPPGRYVDAEGAVAAPACALGSYQRDAGQAACLPAPVGTYVDVVAATEATACPAGQTTLDVGSTRLADCLVLNEPPVANAGPNQTVVVGQTVTLDGSGSTGPGGNPLTYAWMLDGPSYTDLGLSGASPTFCAAEDGVYTAVLTVSDGDLSDSDGVEVTAVTVTEALSTLVEAVEALGDDGLLNGGRVRALTVKLKQAARLLGRGQTNGTLGVLAGYEQQLADLVDEGVLTAEQAEALSADATTRAVGSPCSAAPAVADASSSSLVVDAAVETGLGAPYPNPSAAGATVPYAVAEAGPVRLAVYDVLAREVAVLVDGTISAGRHEAALGGAALPPGTYLVRMTAGAFSATERLTAVR